MKNKSVERLKKAAKLHQKSARRGYQRNGIRIYHSYDNLDPERLSWWDDVSFILNDYSVFVSWVHPRMVYQDLLQDKAHQHVADLYTVGRFDTSVPIYKKVGRSRKKISSWELNCDDKNDWFDAYKAEYERLSRESRLSVSPFMSARWANTGRFVEICIPVEVRNENDLLFLANMVKRLLKRETSLEKEFPGYAYQWEQWQADML